ncbi:MAG: alanine racemase [Butyrivibrio sp.]|nr:alanine racemase [Butyrivibrio sp.]
MLDNLCRVYANINLDAVLDNLKAMKANIPENTKMLAVIKTDGYGFGAVPIARMLEDENFIWGYATATAEEAFELRDNGVKKPILILGYTFPYAYDRMILENIRPAVFRYDMLEELGERAEHLKAQARNNGGFIEYNGEKVNVDSIRVHIAVDTGMSRIGITPDDEGICFIKKAFETKGIIVEGIFTHFARADEADLSDAHHKKDVYAKFLDRVKKELGRKIEICHCANSASIIDMPESSMDMVRAGVSMYGMWPSEEVSKNKVEIKPVLELKSNIVYIKDVPKGTPVSYGGTYVTDKLTRIATIPVGYGDGYPRSLSNKGFVLIRGKKARILGRVCMDQFMVDITDIFDAKEGDEVTLIGRDGDIEITIEELGDMSGRFNYELACDLNKRIPRVYNRK